jgi:hypothetical protein
VILNPRRMHLGGQSICISEAYDRDKTKAGQATSPNPSLVYNEKLGSQKFHS